VRFHSVERQQKKAVFAVQVEVGEVRERGMNLESFHLKLLGFQLKNAVEF
jgi:hypothetical protein